MPKQMLTLNDFSGGLNTKSSPRDIAPNQLQLADNVKISNPGLIESLSPASDKSHQSNTITRTTPGIQGTGAFFFNHEFDISDGTGAVSQTAQEIVAYPDNTSLKFLSRKYRGGRTDLDAFTDVNDDKFNPTDNNSIDNVSDGVFEPVYYYIDGVLYVADRKRVDTSGSFTQKSIQLIEGKPRFNDSVDSAWITGDAAVESTTDAIFEAIENEATVSLDTPDAAGEFRLGFNSSPSQPNLSNIQEGGVNVIVTANPSDSTDTLVSTSTAAVFVTKASSPADLTGNSDLQTDDIIYMNKEAMKIVSNTATTNANISKLIVQRGYGGTKIVTHSVGTTLQKSSSETIPLGGFPSGTYEFTYTLVDYSDDETLPHVFNSALSEVTLGEYDFFQNVDVKMNISGVFRKKEKGFRIYTRIKDSNDRFILFLDCDYERGARRNLFEEYTAWTNTGTYGSSGAEALTQQLDIVNPSLETYESINGYSHDEKSITLGDKGGYKAATICARRAWIANVRKDDIVYDDRIYYTPVNKFGTFPDSYFLDLGINDGDSFSALHSLGNRLLAFKQKKLYVINVSSSSDAGWYLEAEYEGVGCADQEHVTKTPFGICWANSAGVFIFDGTRPPVELSANFSSYGITNFGAVGYDNSEKQLIVCVNTRATNDFDIYDFKTKSWTVSKVMFNGMSNFFENSSGLFFIQYASSGNNKNVKKVTSANGTLQIDLKTKDIDFGSPGKIKKIYKVYITAKDDGGAGVAGNTLTLKHALNGSTSFSNATTAIPNSDEFTTLVYTLNVDCESIAFELVDESGEKITINDITIEYRQKNKRAS